jgi:signal transduction histidine kinase/GTP-sensing pleiotropic transcriptional regulator CodY
MARATSHGGKKRTTRTAATSGNPATPVSAGGGNAGFEAALEPVLQDLVAQAVALLDGDGGGFYLANPPARTLRCVVASGSAGDVLGIVLRYGEGAAGRVAETAAPLRIDDYRTWPGRSPQFEKSAPFRAVLSVPTLLHGSVTGVLHVLRTTGGQPFTEEDALLLTVFANQAGAMLENARLLEETNRRVRQLSLLNDLTRAALAASDLRSMSQVLAEQMGELVGADGCHLVLWDEAESLPRPMAASGVLRGTYGEVRPRPGQITLTESSLRAGRPVPVEDCLNTPYISPEIAASCPYRSMLGVPLIVGRRWLGAALLAYRGSHTFDEEEIALCEQAGGQVALALAKVGAFEAERQHRDELEGLRRASLRMTSSLELRPVLEALLDEALHLVEAHDANLFFYEGERLTFGAALWGGEFRSRPFAEPRPDGLTQRVARSGQRLVVQDARQSEFYEDLPWDGSIVGLPIRVGGAVRGVMTMAFPAPGAVSEARLRVLELFADQAGIAIENARLFDAIDTERQRVRLLYEIGREASGSLDTVEILRRAIGLATSHFDARRGAAYLLDNVTGRLRLVAVSPPPEMPIEDQDRVLEMRLGKGLSGWVAERREAALVPDILADDRWVADPAGEVQGGAALAVPVMSASEVLGVLTIVGEEVFGGEHLELLLAIGRQVGVALANAKRYQQVTRRLAERTALQQVAQVVGRKLELEPLLEEVVGQVSQVLGYPVVEIFLIEGDDLVLKAANGSEGLGDRRIRHTHGVIGRAVRANRPVFVPDVRLDADYVVGVPSTRAEIAVPLYNGDIVVGVLNVESPLAGGLTEEDLNLLTLMADQVSVALENAALYERLRQHTAELQQTVSARTGELERALAQAQAADQLKTRFVADVSHELRTPLTNIRLYLDLLDKGRSEKFADYLETLHRETSRLIDLIEDLLTVSRLDAGTAEMDPTWIDLNSMAAGLVEDRRRLVARVNLTIDFDPQADLPLVRADERMISQVMANLMTNAVNYTLPGGRITVRTDTIADGEKKWSRLAVVDTGLGIPENEVPRLFERFFRGSASRTRGISGTGLGLAICKEILDRHGGRITASSQAGKGSTFTIWLPVQRITEVVTSAPASAPLA